MTENTAIQVREDSLKSIMRSEEIRNKFAEVIGSQNAAGYISGVLIAVGESQYLQRCTPVSIISSALRAATLRLSCDPFSGQAFLVPFKDKATLVVGWKGIYHMAIRTGQYRYLNLHTVYEGETVTQDRMTGMHKFEGGKVSDTPIGYLLYFKLVSGFEKTFYMTTQECLEHGKKYSKSFNRDDSLWKTNQDAMCKKTVMRLGLTRWGYLAPSDVQNMKAVDDEGDLPSLIQDIEPTKDEQIDPRRAMADLGFEASPAPEEPPDEIEGDFEPVSVTSADIKVLAAKKGIDTRGLTEILDRNNGDLQSAYTQLSAL